ncbi:MAG: AarF/ABC1/UbiB kinase family protein [Anaerolineae bacterium]|nr:AarF/ABC1/UbiB kinase family protein [Anaerolineae bacterium]
MGVTAFRLPTITRPIRHLQRYRQILVVFTRHGFGFALAHLPTEPLWLRDLYPLPKRERASLPFQFRQALEELGPAFVKLGQVLSTRPDLLPPDYIVELTKLQDEVPPVGWPEIEQVLISELGRPLDEIFVEINTQPLAAASLAQVHLAKLRTHERVALKIQRPNILRTLRTDLEIIHDIAEYAQSHTPLGHVYNLEEIAEDFADTLNRELDYVAEGRNADRFRRNFADEPGVYIPAVHWDYTTKRLLVMEYLEGIKIDQVQAIDAAGHDREAIATNAARMIIQEVLLDGFFHADPHPGNFMVMGDNVIGALDFGMVGYLSRADRVNLIRLYNVAVQMNAKGATEELIHIGAAPYDVDRQVLTRDIERLLQHYGGRALKDIHLGDLVDEVMPVVFEHRLKMPTNYWLLAKTLAMMEGIGLKLAPEFDIFRFSAPYVNRLILQAVVPDVRWFSDMVRRGMAWTDLLDELPRAGRLLIDRLEKREPVQLALDERSLSVLDRLATRLALSLIVAGMIVGLAWLIPAVTGASWLVQASVIVSFIVAILMGFRILWSIVRKR